MIKKLISDDKNSLIVLFIYTFLLLFFCSMMSPLYPINDWSDINLYFNLGKAMMNGRTLYTEAFDHKGPFIFFIYGIGYLISNASFFGMYIIESLCWVAMVFAAYFTARLYVEKIYAFIVALVVPLFILSHSSQGGSAEEFIVIFEAISLWLFIKYFKGENKVHKPTYMAVHGLMVAATLFSKINLVIFWFFPLLAIFVGLLINKEYRNFLQNIAAFFIGFLIISLPISLYLLINGALGEAYDIYITLNRSYARIGGLMEVVEGLAVRFYLRFRFETFEFLIIMLGAVYFPIKHLKHKLGRISIILSFVAVYVAIFITPGYVYYYSIPYYVFCIPGCIVVCKLLKLPDNRKVYALATTLALVWGVTSTNFFGMQISELFGKAERNTVANRISKVIESESNPTLINLGLDGNNTIFTKLNIVPNVKYFVTPNLPYDIYPEMRNAQTKYIENKEVQFVILPKGALNFDYFFTMPTLQENYSLVDTYEDEEKTTFYLYKRID